jgi:uncharacterized protein (TIGR03437 family)
MSFRYAVATTAALLTFSLISSAAPNRITQAIDRNRVRLVSSTTHGRIQKSTDLGPADAAMKLDHVQIFFRPSAAQQADLDQLLADQQNPNSRRYRQWLTPGQFAENYGLSAADHAKIVAWLSSEGLNVQETSSGRNWISFSGTAGQIGRAFRTEIHRYNSTGETHYANSGDVSVPAAIADLVAGFSNLNDFRPTQALRSIPVDGNPDYTSGKSHYLAPADFSTIYNLGPLYKAGFDGTGQSLVVVGDSDISITDIRSFRTRFGLPANDPKLINYGADPGFNGAQFEANLDIEWSGAIAPKATVNYVYGPSPFTAWSYAVSLNIAPIVSISFGFCELDDAPFTWRTVAQQGNAQGITTFVSSGDSGAASCDPQGLSPLATHGKSVSFPANLPEVTAVGGTIFDDATGPYWAVTNDAVGSTALSYIPELAWNESTLSIGLLASGGGASRFFGKPDWQVGPGVPADGARDVPDISLAAAVHDGYLVYYQGGLYIVGGTSASSPSMAGITALLNQYLVKQGTIRAAGLGNLNPALYQFAQRTPAAFHDITGGDNVVPCLQGSADCTTNSMGYAAGAGYDLATGLGSIDANVFVTSFGAPLAQPSVSLTLNAPKVTVNDSVTATVVVSGPAGPPTGTVNVFVYGTMIGSTGLSNINGQQTATVSFPAWTIGTGNLTVVAQYAGNAGYAAASASARLQVTLPTTPATSSVTPSIANPLYGFRALQPTAVWQVNISLRETAGVPALLTGFSIDSQTQPLAQTFPSQNIPAGGTLSGTLVLNNVQTPSVKIFLFTGTDPSGQTWTRQVSVTFLPPHNEAFLGVVLWGTPLVVQQNPAASCKFQQQIIIEEAFGNQMRAVGFYLGAVNKFSSFASIFGTTRLAPFGSLQGTVCWDNPAVPSTEQVYVAFADPNGNVDTEELNVTFTGPAPTAVSLSATPAAATIKPPTVPGFGGPATISVNLSDKTQAWNAAVYPNNRTTSWLQLSQYAGTGPGTIALTANAADFKAGAYKATVVIQSPNSVPQWVSVPVMWVNNPQQGGPDITSASNALSGTLGIAPGSITALYGTQLAGAATSATTLPLDFSLGGVSATVNGWPAPLLYASPTQLNVVVPWETSAGPAVVSVNNNGQIAGFMVNVSPAAPGILTDGNGKVLGAPAAGVKAGAQTALYLTGIGDITAWLTDGVPVSSTATLASLPRPLLPVSVTVNGNPALIQFAGMTPGVVGLAQINYFVPSGTSSGAQPVVVTVNGAASAAANITVAP